MVLLNHSSHVPQEKQVSEKNLIMISVVLPEDNRAF